MLKGENRKAAVGVEPTNNGFANRRLRPLGYAASHKFILCSSAAAKDKPVFSLPPIAPFFKQDKRFFCPSFTAQRQYFRSEKRLTL
jgi:hypothetical protein